MTSSTPCCTLLRRNLNTVGKCRRSNRSPASRSPAAQRSNSSASSFTLTAMLAADALAAHHHVVVADPRDAVFLVVEQAEPQHARPQIGRRSHPQILPRPDLEAVDPEVHRPRRTV